jgi:RNA polymerase sigma-70 factor (ECF subfamily)
MHREPLPAGDDEPLIADLSWIRRVAGELAADADRADDLAQDACVVALSRAPSDGRFFRGWLARVMQNLVRQDSRGARRRQAREEKSARTERLDSTHDLVARASLQRKIVNAVMELDEPYRSTILLRYFEDLPPREIARREGIPSATVHSRLKRALAKLREKLDDTRNSWSVLLVPLASKGHSPFSLTVGGMIVNAKVTLAALSIAIVATVVAIVQFDDAESAPAVSQAIDSEKAAPVELSQPLTEELTTASPQRAELAGSIAAESTKGAPATAEPALYHVRGRVIDANAAAVAGLALTYETRAGDRETKSGPGGVFEFDTDSTNGRIAAKDARFSNVRNGFFRQSSSFEPIVIVANAIDVGGSVLDPSRMPVRGARVSLLLPEGFSTRFGQVLEATSVIDWSVLTDASGHFTLEKVPQIDGANVRALVDGYQPAIESEPAFSDRSLVFALQRPATLVKGALRGRVLDPSGHPAAEARVAAGLTSTVTDASGEFAIDLARAATADVVTAVKTGFRPARMERPDEAHGDRPEDTGWPDFVELRLGGPPLSIQGRVVDPEGKARPNVRVWAADPTPFGLIGRFPAQNEGLMAGAAIPRRALEPDPNPPSEDGDADIVNRNAGGPATVGWHWVEADAEGRFELGGLDDRRYTLRVLDTKTLQSCTSRPIQAGDQDARIEMPAPEMFAKLVGHITTVGERPVAGVSVQLRTTCFETHTRVFGGTLGMFEFHAGGETSTDAEGRFEFKDVPKEGVFFVLRSDRIVPCDWKLPDGADPENLDVRVDVRCQLEVRLKAPSDRADFMAMVDEGGDEVALIEMNGESVHINSEMPLTEGRSGVLSASSSARTLVLYKNGKEIERVSIALVPDEINVIEL